MEDNKTSPKKDKEGPREEEEENGGHDDVKDEETPPKNKNSRKRKREEDLDQEDHEIKREKEFESREDLEELMWARAPRGNYRKRDEGPSNQSAEVWQEIWEDDLRKKHRRNFYRE